MRVKVLIFLFITISATFNFVQTFNILGVFPFPVKSHFFVFKPLLEELAKRGHNLTVISYYPQKTPVENYRDINLNENAQPTEVDLPVVQTTLDAFFTLSIVHPLSGSYTCRQLLEDENVENLWESRPKFDLIIAEQFNSDCSLGLAHQLGAPVMGISAHMMMPWHYKRFGVPYNPSYTLFDFLEGGTKPTLFQRIQRSIWYTYSNFIHQYLSQSMDHSILLEFFDDVPPLEELGRNIKFLLLYQHFLLSGSTLLPSNVIEVGGFHVSEPKTLPAELQKFIDESEHGVVYISFGSILKSSKLPKKLMQDIIEVIRKIPQRIVWKWERKTKPGDTKKIYFSKWMPQNDLLAHPNVVAFYSHCGLLGTMEAIHHGVPIIGMPVYGDQPANAAAIEESGLGVQIDINNMTKEILLEKFKTVLDPEFRKRVKLLSQAWKERSSTAMDTAVFWTEFAARYQNFTFRAAAADVPLYQYFCLDILFVFIAVTIAICLIFKCTLYLIKTYLFEHIKTKSKEE